MASYCDAWCLADACRMEQLSRLLMSINNEYLGHLYIADALVRLLWTYLN